MMYKRMAIVCLSLGNLHCLETKPKDVWEDVSSGVKNLFDDISDIQLRDLIDTLKDGSSDVLDWLDKQVDILKEGDLEKLLNKLQYKNVFDWVKKHSTMTYQELQELLSMIHTTGKDYAPKVQKFIESHFGHMSETWKDNSDKALDKLKKLLEAVDEHGSGTTKVVMDWVNEQINKDHEDMFDTWIEQATGWTATETTALWTKISKDVLPIKDDIHDHIDYVLDMSMSKLNGVIQTAGNVTADKVDEVLDWLQTNMNKTKFIDHIKKGQAMATDELNELLELLKETSHSLSTEITNVNAFIKASIDDVISGKEKRWDGLKEKMSTFNGTAKQKAEKALDWMNTQIS